MKAMILAAGLGTRLRPLTNDRPKALVEISGRTLLEITLTRLRAFGVRDVIINVHHFADAMLAYLQAHQNFGMHIEVSREDILLDTGGGLKNAAWFFSDHGNFSTAPFILHNVDVLSTIDLGRMLQFHERHHALATLAVQDRKTSRYLLFDHSSQLCGRRAAAKSELSENPKSELVRPSNHPLALAFAGIHVISPRLLSMLTEDGVFSIIDVYLRLASQAEPILAFRADEYYWRDLGTPEHLAQAAADLDRGVLSPWEK
jgi:NDP-sugar pyrophosphorylase family protein